MVMEYVEGTTLADRLEKGPIPAGEAVNYISQVLSGAQLRAQQQRDPSRHQAGQHDADAARA